MFSAKHTQTINHVFFKCRNQWHLFDCMKCPAMVVPGIQQCSSSSSASEPEKEPRFRPFNSFQTFHGAKNQLISGPDYSILGSDKPVPFGARERRRLKLQHQRAADILRLLKEIEYAKQRGGLVGKEKQDDEQRQQIIEQKLKTKKHLEIDPSSGEVQGNTV
ncbi:hypothetical protein FHG87_011760 [Trinorchestia longiramus]|nr:hypothetical protein FHG87_011760 [Trinorchestia longiramus]